MRKKFPGFYPRADDETDRLWKEGWFVFDTNILLNLYRYGSSTRDEWLAVIVELRERLWLPHQVALEYQRNRRTTINKLREQFSKMAAVASFDTLKAAVAKQQEEMRFIIDASQFLAGVEPHFTTFAQELEAQKRAQLTADGEDPIRQALDPIAVGEAYIQAELEQLYVEGDRRYQLDIPPGYADKTETEIYTYEGRTYKRKLGWRRSLRCHRRCGS
jgi:hypothetical protein